MKRPYMKAAAILGTAAFLFTSGFARAEDHAAGTAGYLKSATYYSDDWVINFWNSESRHMDQELARIARDGFNNIILVVPWRNSSQACPHAHTTSMPGTSWTVSWMPPLPGD